MGLFQKAVETYDCFRDSAGVYFPGQSPLAPISHIVTRANIEITLNRDGAFLSARAVDKNEPKTIIPVTESSAGRSSNNCPHPLCDQLAYLASYDEKSAIKQPLYIQQLQEWAESPYSHPMLKPILTYVSGGTILQDLAAESIIALEDNGAPKKPKLLVRWVVNGLGEDSGSCHTNQKLFDAFIRFYESKQPKDKHMLCMVTGKRKRLPNSIRKALFPKAAMPN